MVTDTTTPAEPLFVKVAIPERPSTSKWMPLIEALESGDAFQIAMRQTSVRSGLLDKITKRYPTKRLRTARVDETHTTVWLVDR